jgi:hypothetical protein
MTFGTLRFRLEEALRDVKGVNPGAQVPKDDVVLLVLKDIVERAKWEGA